MTLQPRTPGRRRWSRASPAPGLLTFESTEHTAYGSGRSTCIDDVVDAYFSTGCCPPPAPAASRLVSRQATPPRCAGPAHRRHARTRRARRTGIRLRSSPITGSPRRHGAGIPFEVEPDRTRSPTSAVQRFVTAVESQAEASNPKPQCSPGTSQTSSAHSPSARTWSNGPLGRATSSWRIATNPSSRRSRSHQRTRGPRTDRAALRRSRRRAART